MSETDTRSGAQLPAEVAKAPEGGDAIIGTLPDTLPVDNGVNALLSEETRRLVGFVLKQLPSDAPHTRREIIPADPKMEARKEAANGIYATAAVDIAYLCYFITEKSASSFIEELKRNMDQRSFKNDWNPDKYWRLLGEMYINALPKEKAEVKLGSVDAIEQYTRSAAIGMADLIIKHSQDMQENVLNFAEALRIDKMQDEIQQYLICTANVEELKKYVKGKIVKYHGKAHGDVKGNPLAHEFATIVSIFRDTGYIGQNIIADIEEFINNKMPNLAEVQKVLYENGLYLYNQVVSLKPKQEESH